ncbi:MAG: hypothetical protein KDE58_28155, partial [Caldilineaceae bacterium]|nr:hypothetical protein [Caldilineaceae bacterium]
TDDDNWHTNPQNWQQSNWQPEETWQRDEWDSDYRSGPAVVPIDDHADLYAGAYDSDVEEEDEDEEWEDFEQEPQDAYDRFHPEPEESNPVHFTIDSIHDRGSTSSANATAQTEWDNADDGKVKTIDELMAERTSSFAAYQDQEDDDFADDEWEDEEYSAYDEDEDEEEDANNDEHPRPLPHTNDRTGHDGTRTSFRKEELDTVDPEAFQHRRPQLPPRPSPQPAVNENRQRERRSPQTQPAARRPRHQLIDQHTLSYQMGIAEYDESKPIVDPDVDKYIGEFGMGTAEKNGVVQPNGDYVAALEVWLFDKSDEKNMGNQTRILLSEYAVDHNLEQAFTKERTDNPRSFTPQPGVHFQLESQNLLLDCTIVDVKYLESGPGKGMFGSVRVDMSVHKKS